MRKPGLKSSSFPSSGRREQTGFTQRAFPARWLGVLLLTTMGAAWATNPTVQERPTSKTTIPQVENLVFEGEPQVVAQLIAATSGSGVVPEREIRSLSVLGQSSKRVVVSASAQKDITVDDSEFFSQLEAIESYRSAHGRYPAKLKAPVASQWNYQSDGMNFALKCSSAEYDSRDGIGVPQTQQIGERYQVSALLSDQESGWGPWHQVSQSLEQARPGVDLNSLRWLEEREPGEPWSARMYFPVKESVTGRLFSKHDGSSPYKAGMFSYDAVTGSFALRLYRGQSAVGVPVDVSALESRLGGGTQVLGDAGLLEDLGIATAHQGESLLELEGPNRLHPRVASTTGLMSLSQSKVPLEPKEFAGGSASSAQVCGGLALEDRMGQVHQIRFRAGRAQGYDWLVGQVCPLSEGGEKADDVPVSRAYDDGFQRRDIPRVRAKLGTPASSRS